MTETFERYSLSTLVAFVLVAILPMAVATGFSNFERPREIVLAIGAGLALISWAASAFRHKAGITIHSPGTLLLGSVFLLYTIASLFWSNLFLLAQLSVISWGALGILFFVLVAPMGKKPTFLDFSTAVAAGTIAAGAFGLYEVFGGMALHPVWRPSGITGGFDAMSFGASYYVLVLPLLTAAVSLARGSRRWFLTGGLLLGALHFAMLSTPIFIAILGGAMVLAALFFVGFGHRQFTVTSCSAIILGVLTTIIALAGLVIMERPDYETDAVDLPRIAPSPLFHAEQATDELVRWPYFAADRTEAPNDLRFRPYLNGIIGELIAQEPILGHGPAGWSLMQTDVVDPTHPEIQNLFYHYPRFDSPHSTYGRVLVEQGYLGFVFFLLSLAGLLTAFFGGLRADNSTDTVRLELWALFSVFLASLAMMYFVPLLELKSSAALFVGSSALGVIRATQLHSSSPWLQVRSYLQANPIAPLFAILAAAIVASAMAGPTLLHAKASLIRGHADHLMLRSYFKDALAEYSTAHNIYPAYGEVLYNIALAHSMLGATEGGQAAITEAVELAPHDARILTHAASLALRTQRFDTAMELGHHAMRTGPTYIPGYDAYAASLQRRARHDDAAAVLKRALELDELPDEYASLFNLRLGLIYDQQFEAPAEALTFLGLARDLAPEGAERNLINNRITELQKKIERQKLEAEGMPIPEHLLPEEPHQHIPGEPHHGQPHPGTPVMPGLPNDEHDHYHH